MTTTANVPAAPAATQVDQVRHIGEVTVSRDKLMGHLNKTVPGLSEKFRMPLETERAITRVVRKATAELVLRGKSPTLAAMLDPKLDIQITVKVFSQEARRKVDKRVLAREEIARRQEALYGEYMGKGERLSTVAFLPLLNEKSTPAKAPLTEAVTNCHVAAKGAKPCPKLSIVWVGVDDED